MIQPLNEDSRRGIRESHKVELSAGKHIDSANTTGFLDTSRGSDFIHPDRLSRLQIEGTELTLQTEERNLNLQSENTNSSPDKRLETRDQLNTPALSLSHLQTESDTTNTTSNSFSLVADKIKIAPPKAKRAKLSMDNYRRNKAIKALGDRAKEVAFGKDETKFVFVDFGDLTQAKQQPLGESFATLTRLHFTQICLAQDFKGQRGSLIYQTLWQGSLGSDSTDQEALQTMDKAWEHLRLSSAGFVSVCADFVVLIYPAIEEWKFIEGNATFSSEMRLRYLVFESKLDFR
jgi:hypothetical protein